MLCIYRSKANFAENMANNVKKRVKVPASTPKRKQRMVCLMTFIHQKMEEDYPTLFNEHDMRR